VTIILIPMAPLLFLWYAFAIPVFAGGENFPSGKALKRSRQLTKGMRGQIFLTFLLMTILTYIVNSGLSGAVPVRGSQARAKGAAGAGVVDADQRIGRRRRRSHHHAAADGGA
jgi:hypothetical protein